MEKRKRERQIYQENAANTASEVQMSFFRRGLKIGSDVYRNKVRVPQPKDVTGLSIEDLDRVLDIKLDRGTKIQVNGGSIQGFALSVNSHHQIRDAYMNMKFYYPDSTHIMCSYVIPGIQKYYCEDFCDDGEYSAGREAAETDEEKQHHQQGHLCGEILKRNKTGTEEI